MKKTDEVM